MGCFHRQQALALAMGLTCATILSAHASACSLKAQAKRPLKVPFCELVKTPQKYSGLYIETTGNYQSGFETVTFSSPDCSAAQAVWAGITDHKMRATFDRDGIAFTATVMGRFTHASDTPVKTKEGSTLQPAFGFLGQFRNLIEIDCFALIRPIKPPH